MRATSTYLPAAACGGGRGKEEGGTEGGEEGGDQGTDQEGASAAGHAADSEGGVRMRVEGWWVSGRSWMTQATAGRWSLPVPFVLAKYPAIRPKQCT